MEREHIDHKRYADAVLREFEHRATLLENQYSLRSIFVGGGTPSLWDAFQLGRVLRAVLDRFPHTNDVEVTAECNPTSLDPERATALANVGVNRFSIGVQSLRSDQLKFLGRLHGPAGALSAISAALSCDNVRVSSDLIFGLPSQPPSDAVAQVRQLVGTGLRHLSCYQLTIEPGTQFGELARRGRLPLADDGQVAESFVAIHDELSSSGFRHYEISNYARDGHESQHNLGYWQGNEYLGLGCAAYGCIRSAAHPFGMRYRNEVNPTRYEACMLGLEACASLETSCEPLSDEAFVRERIMLGLRTRDGIDLDDLQRNSASTVRTTERLRAVDWLVARNRIVVEGSALRIPETAWLWADDTAARLF